ncbi:MAG: Asp-tRNA(Asn)/Glu-tRNA(Gln) amidotransferase subunit GatA [Bdellovibrionaceae bacterium]|nr:Asp-tRNA(Asn)/Glu-tRNA(Gln) amidotransferase subunit GatA [Pseudobdellovibrionaceae bacterium]
MDIHLLSVKEIAQGVRNKKFSAQEVARSFMGRIEKHDKKVNAFITLNPAFEDAARSVDARIAKGENPGFLAGVPIAVKDLFCTQGIKTTAGSKMLSNFIPPYTATCVERLEAQGALVIGKTNMDEFAMGSSNETSYFGGCNNPWDLAYVAGGSSGGSAAAVAAHFAPASLGSDTGGSIRQPASFCGLVGLKPTYGRISRFGMVAFASSLDQAGPMGKTVDDCTYLLDGMCGPDEKDSTTSRKAWDPLRDSVKRSAKLKVGLPVEYFKSAADEVVLNAFWKCVEDLKKQGVEFVDVSLPNTPHAVPVYYMVATSEASSNLSRYDGIRYGYRAKPEGKEWGSLDELYSASRAEGFGKEVKRRILLGTFALSSGYYDAYYVKASKVRRLIRQDFIDAFKGCDLIMGPVTTTPAFKTGTRVNDPMKMYLNDIFTTSVNLSGLPGMSVPVATTPTGLPLGVQIIAPHFAEKNMLSLALEIEAISGFVGKVANGIQ